MHFKGCFPSTSKKENILKNDRPILLLPIFGNVMVCLVLKSLYLYLIGNKIINRKQSGFIKGGSTTNQLLYITHIIHSAFDCDAPKEVRSVYLDISKVFDKIDTKVWYLNSIKLVWAKICWTSLLIFSQTTSKELL